MMRTNEQRVAAVKQRVREMEARQKAVRKARWIEAASLAACLAVILLVGAAMPGVIARFPKEGAAVPSSTASIFQGGDSLGYIIIGALAFILGVCFTILCVKLRAYTDARRDPEASDG